MRPNSDRKPPRFDKKFPDNLSRFRNDVKQFTEKCGGVKHSKKGFKAPITRKEKRKFERQLKNAKKLAFTKKEKMPTLDNIIQQKKKSKQKPTDETKPEETAKKTAKQHTVKQPKEKVAKEKKTEIKLNSIEMVETKLLNEEKKKKKYEKSAQHTMKHKLLEDNEQEDKEIARLEKMLHIKKGSKKLKQTFYDEGLGDLLDFCDEGKRAEISKAEGNAWLDQQQSDDEKDSGKKSNKKDLEKMMKMSKDFDEESNEDQSDDDDDQEEGSGSDINGDSDQEQDNNNDEEGSDLDDEDDPEGSDLSDEDEQEGFDDEEMSQSGDEQDTIKDEKLPKGTKEDIYGRLVDKKGNIVKSEKYVPPAQRLKELLDKSTAESSAKLAKLSKQINGLLNRLSTANMHSICNQIIQMFYSNQFTRFELIETIYSLFNNSLIKSASMTPIRLLVEHAALVCVLSANIGIELGANLLQKFSISINECLNSDECYSVENKTLDNLLLLLCNLYNFKLFSANLLLDLLNDKLAEQIKIENETKLEKILDLILLIFRCVGLSMRKDNPVQLKDLIVNLQTNINKIKNNNKELIDSNVSVNNRLKFMIESINAIKNNDIRKLDAYDQEPIEQIKRNAKALLKEDQTNQLNIKFKDLLKANELGRWWIVGSAWQSNEDDQQIDSIVNENVEATNKEGFSDRILKLAKQQHMNTDIRRAIFCVIVSAEDYTDAFMKLVKLSLKKQQEREIIYVIMHCALNEKTYNPYYSFLMQKFCQYDRRFKMTLTFHSWDKFKMLSTMNRQQISNFAYLICHLISSDCVTLSILKNVEFGEMNKYLLQFLSDLIKKIFTEQTDQRFQEIFLRISGISKLSQLRNALKLFISHFVLTDKGKPVELDQKLKSKCELAQKFLSINSDD